MLEQLFNIVKHFGQDTVVNNPEVPNEHNQDVMADATKTIASGFQNITAGGGFQSILDLFKGGGNTSSGSGSGGGLASLVKNPIVTMMVGYFISKLVSKYKMSPSAASSVANNLIPNSLNSLIQQTNDSGNPKLTLDGLIGSLVGGNTAASASGGRSMLQDLLGNLTGGNSAANTGGSGGFNIQDIIGNLTQKAQNNFQGDEKSSSGGGGLMDMIKGFMK